MEYTQDIEVRQPRWLFILCIIIFVAAVVLITLAAVEMSLGDFTANTGTIMIVISFVFLFASILGMYSCRNDIFKYSDGKFLCKRIFCKTKTWSIEDVSRVELIKQYQEKSPTLSVWFWDKNDKIIVKIVGISPLIKDNRLKQLLAYYNIPMEIKTTFK